MKIYKVTNGEGYDIATGQTYKQATAIKLAAEEVGNHDIEILPDPTPPAEMKAMMLKQEAGYIERRKADKHSHTSTLPDGRTISFRRLF